LVSRNYRLYLFGQAVSLIGTWMQQVALSWLLYRLTGSPLWLGIIGFASQLPMLLLGPLAGVAADRWNRQRALLVTQSLAMGQATLLLAVTQAHDPPVGVLVGLGVLLGVINAFDMPIRQAFLSEIVSDRGHLGNAIALNSSVVNGARLVGPSLAGLIIATWGESACFLLNALSYGAVLGALLAMRSLPTREARSVGSIGRHLAEGMRYAFGFPPIRALIIMTAVISTLATPLSVLMPVFAKERFQGDATTQGILMGAMGAGAVTGALYLASRQSVLGLGLVITRSAACFGLGLIGFSLAGTLPFAIPALALVGFCMMLHLSACNTLLQTLVDEDKRGRVMSFFSMAFLGTAPLGALLAGSLAEQIGAPATVRIAGAIAMFSALVLATQMPRLRRLTRPVYERIGVLPPPPTAKINELRV
jgi:MFS family permease